MSNVFVDKNKLDILANAISNKSGESLTLTLDEMVEAVDGIESGGGGITPTGNIDITQAGVTDVTNYATATVPQGEMYADYTTGYKTVSGVRKWYLKPAAKIESGDGYGTEGYIADHTVEYGNEQTFNAVASGTTVTPTTSAQTIGGANYMMEGAVTVSAMPTGTAGTPTATKGAVSNHSVSVTPSVTNTTGYITGSTKTGTAVTVSASELVSGSETKTANGTYDVTNLASLVVNVSGGINAPTFTQVYDDNFQTIITTACDKTFAEVSALISDGVEFALFRITNQSETAEWLYGVSLDGNRATLNSYTYILTQDALPSAMIVYSSDGTVTISNADNLVSLSVTSNGTYTPSHGQAYNEVVVNVSGGSSKNAQVVQGTTRTTSSSLTAIGAELTVSKTGTYNVYWSAFRSNTSSQYTFATKLYINGTGYGSEQTTWSNHQQNVHLSNVSLSANDKIRVYGRESRGSSYYMYAGTLTIVEA